MPRKRKFWFIDISEDKDGNPAITLPDEMQLMGNWRVGEKIVFISDGWGNWEIMKVDEDDPGNWILKEEEDASEV